MAPPTTYPVPSRSPWLPHRRGSRHLKGGRTPPTMSTPTSGRDKRDPPLPPSYSREKRSRSPSSSTTRQRDDQAGGTEGALGQEHEGRRTRARTAIKPVAARSGD